MITQPQWILSYEQRNALSKALLTLSNGGVILYPTDTIWGIGCSARDRHAISEVRRIKGRTMAKGFVTLVDSIPMLTSIVGVLPESVERALGESTRPTTVVYPTARRISRSVCAKDGSVAIRVVSHILCTLMVRELGGPIVSTSANLAEYDYAAPPHIPDSIIKAVDYAVPFDLFKESEQVPSRILRLTRQGELETLRD